MICTCDFFCIVLVKQKPRNSAGNTSGSLDNGGANVLKENILV